MNRILFTAIGLMLLFSSILKLIYNNYTRESIKKMDIFPANLTEIIAFLMPIFELFLSVFFISNPNLIINALYIGYLLFFIILNLKMYKGNVSKECCCYGKLLKSKLGLGGMIHYLYWLVILIISIIDKKVGLFENNDNSIVNIILLCLLVVANSLFIRRSIESIS